MTFKAFIVNILVYKKKFVIFENFEKRFVISYLENLPVLIFIPTNSIFTFFKFSLILVIFVMASEELLNLS